MRDDDDDVTLRDEDEVLAAPQEPGDPGYEPPAIIPELDGQGGTVFRVGEETYASMEEAQAAIAPPEEPEAEARRGRDDDE